MSYKRLFSDHDKMGFFRVDHVAARQIGVNRGSALRGNARNSGFLTPPAQPRPPQHPPPPPPPPPPQKGVFFGWNPRPPPKRGSPRVPPTRENPKIRGFFPPPPPPP